MRSIKIVNNEGAALRYGIEPWAAGGTLAPGETVVVEYVGTDDSEISFIMLNGVAYLELFEDIRVTKSGIVQLDMLP